MDRGKRGRRLRRAHRRGHGAVRVVELGNDGLAPILRLLASSRLPSLLLLDINALGED